MKTITGTLKAWRTEYNDIDDFTEVGQVVYSNFAMEKRGWMHVGSAEIVLTLLDDATVFNAQIDALKAQKTKIKAEAQHQVDLIDERIGKLFAIENKGE